MTRDEMELAIGRVVLERGPNIVVVADASGKIRYVNGRFTEKTGWTEEEVAGRELGALSVGNLSEAWRLLRAGKEWRGELAARKRDGGAYWELAAIAPVKSPDGSTAIYLKVSSDITDAKRAEAELLGARDEAEKAVEARSQFLANMSHEIRTPIHAIIGNTELLQATPLNEEQKDYTQTVKLSADVLLTLINDILDISKIEAGKLELESIPFDVIDVMEEAVGLVALQAHRKGLEIVTYFPDLLPHLVIGDPLRLRQVLVNLLNNAVKFTEKGEVELSVEPAGEDWERACLRFLVRDTGIGIPRDKAAVLFEPFVQLDSSTTRKYGGSGLGLAICRTLAERMGGGIGVESREGEGSTFRFTAGFDKQEVASKFGAVAPDFFGGLRALIVDDNAASRGALARYLSSWGCAVSEAADGAGALALLREKAGTGEAFRAALVDLRLPGMDGWQVASEVNADPAINSVKLVLLTPFGLGEDEAKMKLLKWFDAYIAKPARKSQLFETMFRVSQLEDELEGADDAEETEPEEVQEISPARVLIAEDHETNRQLFAAVLSKLGHTFSMAVDGAQAVEMARTGSYDIVFMDVQMPVMNGLEAAREIRASGNGIPIIAVTANATKEEERRCRDSGMDGFLTKPFRMQDLADVMDQRLGKRGMPEDAGAGNAEGKPALRASTEPFVLDFPAAVTTFMGDRKKTVEVLTRFIADVRGKMPEMARALRREDLRRLGRDAHGVKGGSWTLCARELGDAAAALESAAVSSDAAAARIGFERFVQAFERLSEAAAREAPAS